MSCPSHSHSAQNDTWKLIMAWNVGVAWSGVMRLEDCWDIIQFLFACLFEWYFFLILSHLRIVVYFDGSSRQRNSFFMFLPTLLLHSYIFVNVV